GRRRARDGGRNGGLACLKHFQFGHVAWLGFGRIVGVQTKLDLAGWSHAWVEETGRPSIRTVIDGNRLAFVQSDPQPGRSLRWTERMEVLLGTGPAVTSLPVELESERTEVPLPPRPSPPQFVLPTGGGLAYGDFTLDDATRSFLLHNLPALKDALTRGAAWVTLWEEMLDRRVQPLDFVSLAMAALELEDAEQNVE